LQLEHFENRTRARPEAARIARAVEAPRLTSRPVVLSRRAWPLCANSAVAAASGPTRAAQPVADVLESSQIVAYQKIHLRGPACVHRLGLP
jgi:hypothetical protein